MPNEYVRRRFFRGLASYGLIIGLASAYLFTDSEYFKDRLTNRPDLLPMKIMTNNVTLQERKVFEMMTGDYFGQPFEDQNTSIWKRFVHYFYPYNNYNPGPAYYQPFYDYKKDYRQREYENHYHFKDY